MPFEYAVRPFQSPDVFGRIVLPSTPSFSTEKATLTWGAKAAPGSLPKPTSMGVNVACCSETIAQSGMEPGTVDILIQGPDNPGSIEVKRSDVVLSNKREQNNCDDWLSNNSYVAAGIKQAFSEMYDLIHASDSAFLPSGSTPGCKQRTTWKYGAGAA